MLFFMWGFITSLNDILIPHLKAVFDLSYAQAMLIQFCFFGSYFVMSIPAGRIIEKFGYSRGIVIGLSVMGLGCLLFYPASALLFYPLFLFALFVLASGITILQVAANPFVSALGKPETASSRLNLSQGFNSLAHTVAPLLGTLLILNDQSPTALQQAQAVQLPYLGLATSLFVLALFFAFAKLPEMSNLRIKQDEKGESIWKHRQLAFGVVAIFLYVGAEVSIGGFLVNFFGEESIAKIPAAQAGNYVSLYWGGAMVGRFLGSALLQRMRSETLLMYSSLGALVLVLLTIGTSGQFAMWTVLSIGLFNSVMFPNIFTLSIQGLEKYTSRGSGLLIMAIVGGAIIPLFQGLLADKTGVQLSFIITLPCYGYVLYYALHGHKPKRILGQST
jgi:MFS transporter, FHS family, L-fucose permease